MLINSHAIKYIRIHAHILIYLHAQLLGPTTYLIFTYLHTHIHTYERIWNKSPSTPVRKESLIVDVNELHLHCMKNKKHLLFHC